MRQKCVSKTEQQDAQGFRFCVLINVLYSAVLYCIVTFDNAVCDISQTKTIVDIAY